MNYNDLTLDQRISLKGYFETEQSLQNCRAIMLLFDFKTAINYFLSEDVNMLYEKLSNKYN